MNSYKGAVLFVDMLGFSALTRGKLDLGKEQCEPWRVDATIANRHQLLAAQFLLAFRRTLARTKNAFANLKIAQLSDCAFLWSDNVESVVDGGRYLMREALMLGLLCRGGLAFGDIHEPNKVKHSLGAFIVGEAVTRAANYEAAGKGTRVFTDAETGGRISNVRPDEVFMSIINPLTGEMVEEWSWYDPAWQLRNETSAAAIRGKVERLVGYHTMLRYSPKMAWSATTAEGRRQIACSVVAVSDVMERLVGQEIYKFTVEHLMLANVQRSDHARKRTQLQLVDEIVGALQL
jgi:hypothetical protein